MAELNELKTPVFDWEAGDFVVDSRGNIQTVTGAEAAEQVAIKALHTARSVYLIYANIDELELDDKYGNDTINILSQPDLTEEARLSEIERAVKEALDHDPWITSVSNISLKRKNGPGQTSTGAESLKNDEVEVSVTLGTIFGQDIELQEVIRNGT